MKIESLFYGTVVVLVLGGSFYFRTRLDGSTPSPISRIAAEGAHSQSNTSRVEGVRSQGSRKRLRAEQPRPSGEQWAQETAADDAVARSPGQPREFADLAELEERQAEEQRLLEEQRE